MTIKCKQCKGEFTPPATISVEKCPFCGDSLLGNSSNNIFSKVISKFNRIMSHDNNRPINRSNNRPINCNEKTMLYGDIETFKVNNISFEMVKVEGGTFYLGSYDSDADAFVKRTPRVTLSSYYIGETKVTQDLWVTVMGDNPSFNKCSNHPVSSVSWNDCQEFIKKLNSMTKMRFRLPTEAEWEYAARGGNMSRGFTYSGSNDFNEVVGSYKVRSYKPNELGIFDMSSTLFEWCSNVYEHFVYDGSHKTNPHGADYGINKVCRRYVHRGEFFSFVDRRSFNCNMKYFDNSLRLAISL